MKITKAMGKAALNDLRFAADIGDEIVIRSQTDAAYTILFGDSGPFSQEESLIALALCAAIAGVKPEDVE